MNPIVINPIMIIESATSMTNLLRGDSLSHHGRPLVPECRRKASGIGQGRGGSPRGCSTPTRYP